MSDSSMARENRNMRWVYLDCAVLVICTGSICAFSVFSGPLAGLRGWTAEEVALAFTVNTAVAPVPMIIGARSLTRATPNQC
jgi:OFA family oxalate/formate antiporter-like MFS transporter